MENTLVFIGIIIAALVVISSIHSFVIGLIVSRVRSPTRKEGEPTAEQKAAQKKAAERLKAMENINSFDGTEQP